MAFVVSGILRITRNWRPITSYLKSRSRALKIFTPEFNIGLFLVVAFAGGTLSAVPPWSSLLKWHGTIKELWERRNGSPPWGHSEENSLARFCPGSARLGADRASEYLRLSGIEALQGLRDAGLTVESERQELVDIARVNGITPQMN